MDLYELDYRLSTIKIRGIKGTTGTQASFLDLFDGDEGKVKALDKYVAREMGIEKVVAVSGQTYSRKMDANVLCTLAGIAQSASKFANDMRILASFKEMEEPFEKNQIGSSAMPYKRNPMRCERITALSRYVMIDTLNPMFTSATQWFERTLDDSANKRISVAEAFLATDAILNILIDVCDGIVVYPNVIRQRVMKELPFIATENIMMRAVKKGGDRQQLHEKLRVHSLAAAKVIKEDGMDNDLIDRICSDPDFNLDKHEVEEVLEPINFVGRSVSQVDEFIADVVSPILEENRDMLGEKVELKV